jgi:hypothetical protein
MAEEQNKAQYAKPTSQLDLEARQEEDWQPSTVKKEGVEPEQSSNGYVGVGLEYQNYANDTESPYQADEGSESKIFEQYVSDDADFGAAAAPDSESEAQDKTETDEETGLPQGTTVPTTGTSSGGESPSEGENKPSGRRRAGSGEQ